VNLEPEELLELLDGLRERGVTSFRGYGVSVRFGGPRQRPDTSADVSGIQREPIALDTPGPRMSATAAVALERSMQAGVHGHPSLWDGKGPPEFPGHEMIAALRPKE
jgi:hypothetical protein